MEERGSARRMTQRQLDADRPPGADPTPPEETRPLTPEPEDPGPPIPRSDVPSDTQLRERQRVWWREREKFEAAQRRARSAEASK